MRQERLGDALIETNRLGALNARDPNYRILKASILARLGDQCGAITLYEDLLRDHTKLGQALSHAWASDLICFSRSLPLVG